MDTIKTARRALVKVWHPDRAQSLIKKQLCDVRCAEINAAFDKAVEKAKVLSQYDTGFGRSVATMPAKEKSGFSSPFVWLFVSGILIAFQAIPPAIRSILAPMVLGVASTVGVHLSSKMVRTCAADQRANWLLLVIASAVVLLVSLYAGSARALGSSAAQVIVIGAVVALPFWMFRFLFRDAN